MWLRECCTFSIFSTAHTDAFIVFFNVGAGDDPTANITCTGISSSYHVGNNIWSTEVDFPVAEGEDTESIPMGDMFHANGTDLWVSSVPASMAVALYDSLYGREVRLDVTCTDANGAEILPTVDDGDSCILFELNFTNYRYVKLFVNDTSH